MGFGMLIGGAISGVVPLVIIGAIIGIIGMICAKFLSVALEEEYYENMSREFGKKLDEYLKDKNNDKNEEICKALNEVKEIVEHKDSFEAMEYGTNESANRILTPEHIGKIFMCLEESKSDEVKSSAANLIRAALIQNQISKEVKVVILTKLAKMAKTENSNSNNNDNNNNAVLTEYFGKDALDSLKALNLPNKKSTEMKQDKNGNQSQIEAKLDEIIDKIKNHTVDN